MDVVFEGKTRISLVERYQTDPDCREILIKGKTVLKERDATVVNGCLAVVKLPEAGSLWRLTHVFSGKLIAMSRSKTRLLELARRIYPLADWTLEDARTIGREENHPPELIRAIGDFRAIELGLQGTN